MILCRGSLGLNTNLFTFCLLLGLLLYGDCNFLYFFFSSIALCLRDCWNNVLVRSENGAFLPMCV